MLRVGIDLVAVETVAATLAGEHRETYLRRVFTEREVSDCRSSSGEVEADRLAARFAAKEAAIKALPGSAEGVPLRSIEVCRSSGGEIELALSGRAAELAAGAGLGELAVSITHEGGLAAASVVFGPGSPDPAPTPLG